MINLSHSDHQILCVSSFQELITKPFHGLTNAMCFNRKLEGDFSEIVNKVALNENIKILNEEELRDLKLSKKGQQAREILLNDLMILKAHGAVPILNIIKYYDRDEANSYFPTDVYSFHVDRSPIPTDTFLCTYHGESSEILPNSKALKKVLVPEIRNELKKLYDGADEGFESFLTENFFDLHYQAKHNAVPISLGVGNIWKLAVDYSENKVLPCVHRAPIEKKGESRLLLIC